jgi:CDP-4-dehydro-6-deoxyglucose reductase, E3
MTNYKIVLKNGKKFSCASDKTIFNAAKEAGIILEHSCLKARCSSCIVKVISGETKNVETELVLTEKQKKNNFILSCNSTPISNLQLEIEDLGNIKLFDKKIVPAKISSITKINNEVIKLVLRLPPTANFQFNSGQYVNIIKDNINRSYSISNKSSNTNQLEFFIKKYKNGLMSKYWFNEAAVNDLLRLEGPLGSFFFRQTQCNNIIFLATGTGIAPIKAIIDSILDAPSNFKMKKFWIFVGARFKEDLFWNPDIEQDKIEIKYIPVLSRQVEEWSGKKGYVQDIVLTQDINLKDAQVYACGSNEMIKSARKILLENSLAENNFLSDAFVPTN